MLTRAMPKARTLPVTDHRGSETRFLLRFGIICALTVAWFAGQVSPAFPVAPDVIGTLDLPGTPAGLSVDSQGRVYVSDTLGKMVRVFSNNGLPLGTIEGIGRPLGIGVGADGTIYVGDGSRGRVLAFSPNGDYLRALGLTDGECQYPNDIAVDGAGEIYVTDSKAHDVKVYSSAGTLERSFGATRLTYPTGILEDPVSGDIYVADDGAKYIRIFGKDGTYKRGIRLGSMFSPRVLRPQGLAVSGGKLYISDAFNSALAEYTTAGTFVQYIGSYGALPGEFRTPLDIVFDGDGQLFVANHNNLRVENIGIGTGYTELYVDPPEVHFTATRADIPLSTNVDIGSRTDGTVWNASVTEPWLSVFETSGTTPASLTVTVSAAGLANGVYGGFVRVASENGVERLVRVVLKVDIQAALEVTPQEINLEYRVGAASCPEAQIHLTSLGGNFGWTASTQAGWLELVPGTGVTPGVLTVRGTQQMESLGVGSYATQVTVDAGQMTGSPAAVAVNLRVLRAGRLIVRSNLEVAGFQVMGPETYTGSGTEWTVDEMIPGEYTISFDHILGYRKPWTRSFTVASAETVEIDGIYRELVQGSHLVTLSGVADPGSIQLTDLTTGATGWVTVFQPGPEASVSGMTVGDFDGDGVDEVAVVDSRGHLEVYEAVDTMAATWDLSPDAVKDGAVVSRYVAALAAADLDDDGKDEILLGSYREGIVRVQGIGVVPGSAVLVDKGILLEKAGQHDFSMAAGDLDCDGAPEIVVADQRTLYAAEIVGELSVGTLWDKRSRGVRAGPSSLTVGDVDGDGCAEIIFGTTDGRLQTNEVLMYSGSGEEIPLPVSISAARSDRGGLSVATGDTDGDYAGEILIGISSMERRDTVTRVGVFEADGSHTGADYDIFTEGTEGVRMAIGAFGGGVQ